MNDERQVVLHVRTQDDDAANRATSSLQQALSDLNEPSLRIERTKADSRTQDMGATLVLVLGGPAVVAVAQGLADWLRRRHADASIDIEVDGARVAVRGDAVAGIDVKALATAMLGKKRG